MSVKSLLQIILLLLIFIVIGGIYYLYFYKGSIKDQINFEKNIGIQSEKNLTLENNIDKEMLVEVPKKEDEITTKSNELKTNNKINKNEKRSDEFKNLTKEVEYITTNKNGDTFKILAKYGKTNISNTNVLDLEEVDGKILSKNRSSINISSKFANYNYTNQNSKFYKDVKISYDNKTITCDNLDLIISENIAVAYSNVIINTINSTMKAQIITLDILTKDIKINSKNEININTKTN